MLKMYGFKVTIHQHCTAHQQSEEAYGDWYSAYDNTFKCVEKVTEYPDLVSIEDLKQGDPVHVVWVEWSSGDSFGMSNLGYVEAFGAFSKWEDAIGLSDVLKASDINGYKFVTSTGQVFECGYVPWHGYFESLGDVHIDTAFLR